jgi:hypothetical protein
MCFAENTVKLINGSVAAWCGAVARRGDVMLSRWYEVESVGREGKVRGVSGWKVRSVVEADAEGIERFGLVHLKDIFRGECWNVSLASLNRTRG